MIILFFVGKKYADIKVLVTSSYYSYLKKIFFKEPRVFFRFVSLVLN